MKKKKIDNNEIDKLLEELAFVQAKALKATLIYVCHIKTINDERLSEIDARLPSNEKDSTDCPPYDKPFRDAVDWLLKVGG